MITKDQIYDATDDGMEILELHIKGAREAYRHKKHVKLREEATASASIKLHTPSSGHRYYGITDFGGDGKMKSPIQLHMELARLTFAEAMLDLGQIFGVHDSLDRSVNRPDIRQEPAPSGMADGHEFYEFLDDFTDDMCRVMGPNVTRDTLRSLNWHPVKFFASVRDSKITYRFSNDRFPIFMRECFYKDKQGAIKSFFKIYEPMNPDKQYRFRYTPRGGKQPDYVNGLWELRKQAAKRREQAEAEWFADPKNEGKPCPSHKIKIPEVIICSGERDSLCARSHGYAPVWLNSETARLTRDDYSELKKYATTIYNCPDIDKTGIRKGTELALEYPDIHTIWLPESLLGRYRDNRGKTRKDLRDWMELRPSRSDFEKLLRKSLPACFWGQEMSVSKDGERVTKKYTLDFICLKNFLHLSGFGVLKDDFTKTSRFIRVTDNIVEEVRPREIRAFVEDWAEEEALDRRLRNLISTTDLLSPMRLESLREIDPDFSNCTHNTQIFHFPRFAVEVTPEGLFKRDASNGSGACVWRHKVIDHDIRILPPMFEITHPENPTRSEDFDIRVTDNTSNFFRYLINSSRLYWRKELETNLEGLSPAEAEAYRSAHRFDIAGEGLDPEEVQKQKQCLINKIFVIGYMMHRFKSPSRAWAPFVMDNAIGENGQCNGGSGKSFLFKALSHLCAYVPLPGRNNKLFDNQFWADRISKHTDICLFDDIYESFPVDQLYDTISGDMTVNEKNTTSRTLAYEEAPKFAFTTNYVPREFNPSTVRRCIYVVVSDYYHEATKENDYRESRKVFDDFHKDLFDARYTEEEWCADINFVMQCVRFYLSVIRFNIKIEPVMDNIMFRKNLRAVSAGFLDWASQYFAPDGEHIDHMVVRTEAYEDYKMFSGLKNTSMQSFSSALQAFCITCDYISELDPDDLCNSRDHLRGTARIMQRRTLPDGTRRQYQMIYVRSVKEAERIEAERISSASPAPPPETPGLPF
ncbi:MAG: toprim domain-containing protein [Duncaniella sp.]|nr:toprim domain-containing protein [Duncaniella sp.]